jgi:hypothetical protein
VRRVGVFLLAFLVALFQFVIPPVMHFAVRRRYRVLKDEEHVANEAE